MATGRSTFLSYAREDQEFARSLASQLRTAGVRLWVDVVDIPSPTLSPSRPFRARVHRKPLSALTFASSTKCSAIIF